jgi:hypothetical protein
MEKYEEFGDVNYIINEKDYIVVDTKGRRCIYFKSKIDRIYFIKNTYGENLFINNDCFNAFPRNEKRMEKLIRFIDSLMHNQCDVFRDEFNEEDL